MVRIFGFNNRMGGRPRIYEDIEGLKEKSSVSTWLRTLRDGTSRKTALYALARYLVAEAATIRIQEILIRSV